MVGKCLQVQELFHLTRPHQKSEVTEKQRFLHPEGRRSEPASCSSGGAEVTGEKSGHKFHLRAAFLEAGWSVAPPTAAACDCAETVVWQVGTSR